MAPQRVNIKHERGPHYTSAVATGVTLTGPTGDGFLHLQFVRDVQPVVEEPVDVVEVTMPGGQTGQQMTPAGPGTVDFHREVVATISVSLAVGAGLAASLQKVAEAFGITTPTATIQNSPIRGR